MIRTKYIDAEANFVPSTSAFTANDVIGGLLTFDIVGSLIGGGQIHSLRVTDDNNIGAAGALWLFNASPTVFADNAAFAPVFADLKNVVTILTLPTFVAVNSLKVAVSENLLSRFKTPDNKLYGYYVTSATPTFGASKNVSVRLGILTE